jgi:hypothetical protein
MLASERLDSFHSFEVTVAAKPFAIKAWPSSNVSLHIHAGLTIARV